jgi:site-specific DNA recombinase
MNDRFQQVAIIPPIKNTHFFTVPTLGRAVDELTFRAFLVKTEKSQTKDEGVPIMRYAAYIRVSDEEQVHGYSLDAQRRAIQEWVIGKGGALVKIYADEGETATSMATRTDFQKMRLDARAGKFDALVVHKFDRFARNRTDSLAIKSLLRYDYKIKVFSTSEPSEDSDGPIGALIEGIMECVAEWYSKNLATEVAKGKRERVQQGLHNNQACFGYDKDEEKLLITNAHEVMGVLMSFESYSTGKCSDADVAVMLNEKGYRTKKGRPFSKDTVREMLQNRTYLGMVKYQEYRRNADRSRSWSAPQQWFPGKHEAIISQELFDRCQEVRQERAAHRQATPKYNSYLLRNMIYCYRCCNNAPTDYSFPAYGKMRAQSQKDGRHRYYRCRAKDFNRDCEQKAVLCDLIESQVIQALLKLKPPAEWRTHITEAMSHVLGEQNLAERIGEIKAMIERMDFRWDQGFITDKLDYLEKRVKLQQELEQLSPIPEDDLERAADILTNFGKYWEGCKDDPEGEHRLIKLIVERVYVQDEQVVAMTLKADYHIVLGNNANGSTAVSVDPSVYTYGDDGSRTRDLCLDRAVC